MTEPGGFRPQACQTGGITGSTRARRGAAVTPQSPEPIPMATLLDEALDTAAHELTVPGTEPHLVQLPIRERYGNWINGEYVAPARRQYFTNPTPLTGQPLCEVARGTHDDVERALDAAHAAAPAWGKTSPAHRALILNRIADRLEENLETLAAIETVDNGKP